MLDDVKAKFKMNEAKQIPLNIVEFKFNSETKEKGKGKDYFFFINTKYQ